MSTFEQTLVDGSWYEKQYSVPGERYYELYNNSIGAAAKAMYRYHVRSAIAIFMLNPGEHNILELGCGMGHYMAAIENEGFECSGVDISKTAIAKSGRSTCYHAGADNLSMFEDDSFSVVFSFAFIEHIHVDHTRRVIEEAMRVSEFGQLHCVTTEAGDDPSHIHVQDGTAWVNEIAEYLPYDWCCVLVPNPHNIVLPYLGIFNTNRFPVTISVPTANRQLHAARGRK
jgi:ubiquinone/menaquinone biosynthesis C-methylase UbiE